MSVFHNFKAILALPKWARIFLAVLSVVAVLGLGFGGALQIWAKDKQFSANLVFNSQNSHATLSSGEFAYKIRAHFESLDFLLRSKTIAKINIAHISWDESRINPSQILSYEAQNRNLALNSTQPPEFFENLKGENLGVLKYKADFSPLIKNIVKYYFTIVLAILLLFAFVKFNAPNKIFAILSYALLIFAAFVRIYQYIFHKDLWLDEAYLAFSMYAAPWSELFFAPLPMWQSVPLLFMVTVKAVGEIFGYSEFVLYLPSLITGILSLFLSLKIAHILFGRNSFGTLCFIALVCGSGGLLYYSAEFKQYGVEAFCGFLLVYLFLRGVNFRAFFVASVLCFLSSHTAIFIALSCWAGILWRELNLNESLKNAFKFSNLRDKKAPIFYTFALCVLFVIYYFAYVKFQATEGFYDYWKDGFLPLNLTQIPAFFKYALSVYSGFIVFNKSNFVVFYMIISIFGFVYLWFKRLDLFVLCASLLFVYFFASALKIYPIGMGGLHGIRLSLFMGCIFFILGASGATFIYEKFTKKWLKIPLIFCLLVLVFITIKANSRVFYPQNRHIEQTREFTTQIATEFKASNLRDESARKTNAAANSSEFKLADFDLKDSQKCVFVYRWARPAFLYYLNLSNLTIPYALFGTWSENSNVNDVSDMIKNSNCQQIWILASHYPPKNAWLIELVELAKSVDKNASITYAKTGWGSVLIRVFRP